MKQVLSTVGFLVVLFSGMLAAQVVWVVLQMGEMTSADFYLLENGSRTTGLLIGKKNSGQNDELVCSLMTNGYQWNPCPPGYTSFSGMGGAFILGAKYGSPTSVYAIRQEIQGFSSSTALIHTDAFLNNMIVHRMFNNDTEPVTGALAVIGSTIWVGRGDGKIFRSSDGGNTFETFTVTSDTKVEIYQIEFTDALHGWAAGGATEETDDPDNPGQQITHVLEKGGVWVTDDGGETWTAIKENLPYSFIKVYPVAPLADTSVTTWYAFYTDNASYAGREVSKHVGVTTDGFATLTLAEPQANTGKKFNGYQAGGVNVIGGTDIWLGGICTDFKACSLVSYDGGATWMEMFLPANVGVQFMWSIKAQSFLDSKHGWAATSVNAILRWGDPNEDLTEQPDTEVPDTAVPDTTVTDETTIPDEETGADTGETPDETTVTDTSATGDDSDALAGDEPLGCGCSVVY